MSLTEVSAGSAATRLTSKPSAQALDRQRRFTDWVVGLFERGRAAGLLLDPLTDFEVEWMGRVM